MKALRTIGFTGTIASGKTSRCKHLVEVAKRWQPTRCAAKRSAMKGSTSGGVLDNTTFAVPEASTSSSVAVQYIDADLVGHRIYEPGTPCYKDLVRHFGEVILSTSSQVEPATCEVGSTIQHPERLGGDGCTDRSGEAEPRINRRALGQIVFSEEQRRQELNAICWPYITAAIKDTHMEFCASLKATAPPKVTLPAASSSPASTPYSFPSRSSSPAMSSCLTAPVVGLVIIEAALLCEMPGVLALTTDVWATHCTLETAIARVMERYHISREAAEQRVFSQRDVEQKLRSLRSLPYKGEIETFDTTQSTLAEGLKEIEDRFARYWGEKIEVHL